jgi:hypothetical protein
MKFVNHPHLRVLAICLAAACSAANASATTYEMRIAAPGIKSPLVDPAITEDSAWTVVYGTQSMQIPSPDSTSTGAFSFTSGNSAVATVVGNQVTFVGAGHVFITAKQAATATHNAGQANISLTVQKAAPNLQAFTISPKTTVDGTFTLPALNSSSPGTLTYASSNVAVVTVAGASATIRGEGSATITANQAETANFTAGIQTTVLVVTAPPLPAGYFKVGNLTWTKIYPGVLNYNAAATYCAGTFNGQTGWRLPSVAEMRSANQAGVMENYGGGNTWNEKVGATFYYSQLGAGAYAGYDSSHGGFNLNVFCVK